MKGDRRYEQTETAALALRCAVDDRLAAALRAPSMPLEER